MDLRRTESNVETPTLVKITRRYFAMTGHRKALRRLITVSPNQTLCSMQCKDRWKRRDKSCTAD